MSELGDKRERFTRYIYMLLQVMYADGMRPRFDLEHCNHKVHSLHYDGLAKDILLFDKNNIYRNATEDHRKYGLLWESFAPDCFWGGNGLKVDGLKDDGNHYAITFQGKK
jgi:hypothetical protein